MTEQRVRSRHWPSWMIRYHDDGTVDAVHGAATSPRFAGLIGLMRWLADHG